MTVLSTLETLCDRILVQKRMLPEPLSRDTIFLDILLESVDSLAYTFLIAPFLYNTQDCLQHLSMLVCDIIKAIDQHESKKPVQAEFLRDAQECLSTLGRNLLSEESAMYV